MRIQSIELENIRCFSRLTLNLDRDVTLIFGANGAGKSTVLDALAAALSVTPGVGEQMLLSPRDLRIETARAGNSFRRERAAEGALRVTLSLDGKPWTWSQDLLRGEQAALSGSHESFVRAIQKRVPEPERALPVLAIYAAHRSWRDRQHRDELPVGRLSGYDGALVAGTDLAHLRAWWRDQDHRRRAERETPGLDAAEEAIARFLGKGAQVPTYSLDEQDILIDLPDTGARLCLRELSDGYRGMVALVADIARRMAQLNPDRGAEVLEHTPGLVAIDELDLHLHPRWQREVLPRLRTAFPAVQFVVTSHSPQVLASVEANSEVIGLSATGEVLEGELAVVGRDSNAILIEVMGDRVRPQRYQQLLDDFYVKVEAGDFPGARAILAELEAKWGADEPTLGDARWALETEEA